MTAPRATRLRSWRHVARAAMALAAAGAAPVLLAEGLHWRASRRLLGPAAGDRRGAQAVLVLGFPSTHAGELRPLQRWRTEIGVRSLAPGPDSRLIFSGGGPPGAVTEAEAMAGYARDSLGMPAERITVETAASTTWENIAFSLPYLESAETIAVASDPLHASRGRRNLRRQRPDLAGRLVAAEDYRFGEHWQLKLATAVYEVTRPPMRRLRVHLAKAAR
ncbi:YdcF family protein [Frankia sp. AgB32]|uniref:YdcF family protein n=1 Tax=Frankia sp. AgB32 TaxID=631119 RepID=UPI0020102FDF|nr:YdcF family protein [Frankia sp. AgB32]MCK9898310.1 YdcF family protein [Frankia sp. AgB32]